MARRPHLQVVGNLCEADRLMCSDRVRLSGALEALEEAVDSEEAFFRLRAWSQADEALRAPADQVEQELHRGGMEIQRLLLQENIRARGGGDVGPALVVREDERAGGGDGQPEVRLGRRQEHKREYESLFGTVDVERLGYSVPGTASIHPLDEELNLPRRRYSYPVQKRAALRASRGPFDEAVEEIRDSTAARVPKRQLEQIVEDAAADFDSFYAADEGTAGHSNTDPILVVGLDCKGVPRRKTEEELSESSPARLGPGEKRTKKKMATVASVHTCEAFFRTPEEVVATLVDDKPPNESPGQKRKRIENRRLWASVRKSKDELTEEVRDEMKRRDPDASKQSVCVMDGERALHRRAVKYLAKAFPNLVLVLDIMHVLGYLWDAGFALCGDSREDVRLWVRDRLLAILHGNVSLVVAGIRQSATKNGLRGKKRETVDIACDYFLANKDRMRYDEYLAAGLPIASGSVEGACGHLVKDRMEMTGALWDVNEERAEAVLRLRALDKSGDFDAYWDFHMNQERLRNYPQRWDVAA